MVKFEYQIENLGSKQTLYLYTIFYDHSVTHPLFNNNGWATAKDDLVLYYEMVKENIMFSWYFCEVSWTKLNHSGK